MRADRRPPLSTFLLFLIFPALIHGVEDIPYSPPEFIKTKWNVGVGIFNTENPGPGMASASTVLPRLIRDELAGVKYHDLTGSEKDYLAEEILKQKEFQTITSLSGLYSSRDDLFFDLNANPATLVDLDKKIRDKTAELSYWRDYSPGLVEIPDEIHIDFPEPPDGAEIWDTESAPPDVFRRNNNLDVLILGNIVRVGDYFGVKITAYGPTGEEVLWEGAGGANELEEISIEAGAAARRVILGRSWASLTVQTEPGDAVITYNGESAGVGFWSDSTLRPGQYSLEITAAGHAPRVIRDVLAPNETAVIDVKLEETEQPRILVRTEPDGANLRLGTIWLGVAPLSIDLPDRVMSLTVEKEGYKTRTVPLYPDAERLTVPLDFALVDPVEELALSRKKLYNSIAWFSFSLAPTIILLGVSQNYVSQFYAAEAAGNTSEQEAALNAYNLTYGLMWGSVAINVGLLTNVIFKLSRYLKAAEELSD